MPPAARSKRAVPEPDPDVLGDALKLADDSKGGETRTRTSKPEPRSRRSAQPSGSPALREPSGAAPPKAPSAASKGPLLVMPSPVVAPNAGADGAALAGPQRQLSPNAVGTMAPGVYLQDITNTLRMNYFRGITVSRHNPNVVYVASWEGYVFKSVDGGLTWDESRLIVDRLRFFGDTHQYLYFGVHRLAGGPVPQGFPGKSASTSGGTGRARAMLRRPLIGWRDIAAGGAGRAGAAENVNFGIGLPGGAPRLQNVVRKFGKPTAGLNIKQTLFLRGYLPTEVRIIVEHPTNPKIVFACTFYGLFMTWDGGLNWVRTFQGVNERGRIASHVAVDPENPKRVLLATGNGVYVSEDSGNNFIKTTQKGVGEGFIDWIYFNPYDSRYVFVGTDYGLLRSKDGGRNWEWIYFTTFPAARVVRYIEIDPHDKRRGYIATHDGLFYTDNILTASLEDWKRLGGLRFTGMETVKIAANPKRYGHLWALSNMRVATPVHSSWQETGGAFIWESVDAGQNWRVLYSGNTTGSMQWFYNDPVDPSLLWIAWSRSLTRMRKRAPGAPVHSPPAAARREIASIVSAARMPEVGDVIRAAMRYSGSDPSRMLKYRFRSRLAALAPKVDVSLLGVSLSDKMHLDDGLYLPLPYRREHDFGLNYFEWRVMLRWDLSPLVFNLDTVMFGRVDRVNADVRNLLAYAVMRLYSEYRRLRLRMLTDPPSALRTRMFYRLRIEELYSYVDFVTGGYLTRYKRGDRPEGADSPWFERWDGTGPDLSLGGKR